MTIKQGSFFSQIYNTCLFDPDEDEDYKLVKEAKKEQRKAKFIPEQFTNEEIFDPSLHITAGPLFDDNFGTQHDERISITVGIKKFGIPFMQSFQGNFDKEILENIYKKGYFKPTPVQKAVIPIIQTTNYDIIGQAQTGSGKTAAFLLPLINEIQKQYQSDAARHNPDSPFIIIVGITRELVKQLYEDVLSFVSGTSVTASYAHGDIPNDYMIRKIRNGCDVFVATIGKLFDFSEQNIISFTNVRYFVLDEADKFMQCNDPRGKAECFEKLHSIKNILNKQSPNHRIMMFSATFDAEAELNAKDFMRPNLCKVYIPGNATVTQTILKVPKYEKSKLLVDMLKAKSSQQRIGQSGDITYITERTIIFVNGKRHCDRLAIYLAIKGFRTISLNRQRMQLQCNEAVAKFIRGEYDILIANNIASRGMNFPNIKHVINYDLPADDKIYAHRIGRTGRAGNIGRATSFFDPMSADCLSAEGLVQFLEESNQDVPDFLKKIGHALQRAEHERIEKQQHTDIQEEENEIVIEKVQPFNDTW